MLRKWLLGLATLAVFNFSGIFFTVFISAGLISIGLIFTVPIFTALTFTGIGGEVSLAADAPGMPGTGMPANSAAAGNKLDLTFVPADAVAISTIQPHRMFAGPQQIVLATVLQALGGKEQLGVNPVEIEQVMMVLGLQDGAVVYPTKPPRFGFVMRFTKPIDQTTLTTKFVPFGNDSEVEKHPARINVRPYGFSCAFADDTTLLIADENNLHWLLTAKPGNSLLQKLAAAADDSPEWQLVADVKSFRSAVEPDLAEVAQHEPKLSALPNLVKLTGSFTATLRQGPQVSMTFDATAMTADEAAAKELATSVKELLDAGRSLFLDQLKGAGNQVPLQAINQMRVICDSLVAALQPTPSGNQVNFHADIKSGPAVIGIGIALLLPAVQAAREAAQRNESMNNLKQINLALLNYEDINKHLPARAVFSKDGKPLLSWRVMILPWIEENELYKQFHLDEPWDSEHNKALIDKMPETYRHPKFNEPGKTLYQAVVGKGLAFEGNEGLRLKDFTDGFSNTIWVVEVAPENAVPWTKPDDWTPDDNNVMKNLGSLFAGNGFQAAFADGHVEWVDKGSNPANFKAMLTRKGGEVVQH